MIYGLIVFFSARSEDYEAVGFLRSVTLSVFYRHPSTDTPYPASCVAMVSAPLTYRHSALTNAMNDTQITRPEFTIISLDATEVFLPKKQRYVL